MTVTPRRVVKRSAAARSIPAPPPLLDEGDPIEYGLTVEYKHPRKGSYWPKMATTVRIRPGETPEEAKARAVQFVTQGIDEQIAEIMS